MLPALLDTDTLSEILKLKNAVVLQHALTYRQQAGSLTFSAVTRYEIRRGYRRKNAVKQLTKFEAFCRTAAVIPVSDAIWDRAADLWAIGNAGGQPHNDADLLIAATALEHNLALVTGNTSHFAWIPGLTLTDWRTP